MSERLPNVSLPTVYATLELFEKLGVVRRVRLGTNVFLYDPRVDRHHHMACRECGRVEDLDAEVDLAPALRAAGRRKFELPEAELLVTGLCSRCAAKARS